MSKIIVTLPQKLNKDNHSSVFIVRDWNPFYDKELDNFVMYYKDKYGYDNVILTIEEFEVGEYIYCENEGVCLVEDGMSGINAVETYRHITMPNDEWTNCEIFASNEDAISFIQSIETKNNKNFKPKHSFESQEVELPYDVGDIVYRVRDFDEYSDLSLEIYENTNVVDEKHVIQPYKVEAIRIKSENKIVLVEDSHDGYCEMDEGITINGLFRDERVFTTKENAIKFLNDVYKYDNIDNIVNFEMEYNCEWQG